MAAPQPGTARRSDEASHKVSTDQSWRKKFEGIYASLLKSDFGKHLPTFGESAEQIEKRHGASLIRKLNAQSLVLQDGSKKPLGDLVLERLGVTDPNEFRLNAKTKAQIESMDLRQVAADSYLKNCLPNYGRISLNFPDPAIPPRLRETSRSWFAIAAVMPRQQARPRTTLSNLPIGTFGKFAKSQRSRISPTLAGTLW